MEENGPQLKFKVINELFEDMRINIKIDFQSILIIDILIDDIYRLGR